MSKPEQERLTAVLKDTIGLLCKNSLTFDKQMVIQGLVAITIDTEDVMVVQINESLGQASGAPCVTCGLSKQSPAPDEPVLASIPRKRRRSHSRSNDLPSKSWRSAGASVHSDGSHLSVEDEDNASVVKAEKESDDEDLIFVDSEMKKEASDVFYDRGNDSSHVDSSYITGYLDNSEISQVTTSSQMNSPLQWQNSSTEQPPHPPPHADNQTNQYSPSSDLAFYPSYLHATTNPGRNPADFSQPQGNEVKKFRCNWPGCQKAFVRIQHLEQHLFVHKGIRPLKCPVNNCSYRARQKGHIVVHLRRVHKEDAALYLQDPNGTSRENQSLPSNATESTPP